MLDKTAQDFSNIEHRAFTWVLNHHHYVKEDGEHYSSRLDYLGHFPEPANLLNTNDLRGFSISKIDSIARYVDMGYFIDTYGSTSEEWSGKVDDIPVKGLIYGGLETEDVSLMQALQEHNKLVLAEFSIFGSPTPLPVRNRAENLLGVHFSGWVGRYWHELDPETSGEIPDWMPKLYEEQYGEEYMFSGPGIGFFHEDGRLLILPKDLLIHQVPILESDPALAEQMNLDPYIRYPFWFEICSPDTSSRTLANYRIYPRSEGRTQMLALGIPSSFPAVLVKPDWHTIYLAGDFTDNPVSLYTSRFAGVEQIRTLFYDNKNLEDREKFFWEWYEPFISSVLEAYVDNREMPNLPQLPPSLYEVTYRLSVDKRSPALNWNELFVVEPDSILSDSTSMAVDSLVSESAIDDLPVAFVCLASFSKESYSHLFIQAEAIPNGFVKLNTARGSYDILVPCRSIEEAEKILAACASRYKNAEIRDLN